MHATVGDRIIVASATLSAPARDGEILDVRGSNGEPPYLVRWSDTGRESLFFPGPDVHVQHYETLQSLDETAERDPPSHPRQHHMSRAGTSISTRLTRVRRPTRSFTVRPKNGSTVEAQLATGLVKPTCPRSETKLP